MVEAVLVDVAASLGVPVKGRSFGCRLVLLFAGFPMQLAWWLPVAAPWRSVVARGRRSLETACTAVSALSVSGEVQSKSAANMSHCHHGNSHTVGTVSQTSGSVGCPAGHEQPLCVLAPA